MVTSEAKGQVMWSGIGKQCFNSVYFSSVDEHRDWCVFCLY
jgi:hypothetical protein